MFKLYRSTRLRRKCKRKRIPTLLSKNVIRNDEELQKALHYYKKQRRESFKTIIHIIEVLGILLAGIAALIVVLQNCNFT